MTNRTPRTRSPRLHEDDPLTSTRDPFPVATRTVSSLRSPNDNESSVTWPIALLLARCLAYESLCNITTNWWFNPSRKRRNYAANYCRVTSMFAPYRGSLWADAFISHLPCDRTTLMRSLNCHFFFIANRSLVKLARCWKYSRTHGVWQCYLLRQTRVFWLAFRFTCSLANWVIM